METRVRSNPLLPSQSWILVLTEITGIYCYHTFCAMTRHAELVSASRFLDPDVAKQILQDKQVQGEW
jgi:hypothetical protein